MVEECLSKFKYNIRKVEIDMTWWLTREKTHSAKTSAYCLWFSKRPPKKEVSSEGVEPQISWVGNNDRCWVFDPRIFHLAFWYSHLAPGGGPVEVDLSMKHSKVRK